MTNTRNIAALEKMIAQLAAIKDRLVAADAKAGSLQKPAKESAAKKAVAKKAPAKKGTPKKTA